MCGSGGRAGGRSWPATRQRCRTVSSASPGELCKCSLCPFTVGTGSQPSKDRQRSLEATPSLVAFPLWQAQHPELVEDARLAERQIVAEIERLVECRSPFR